MGKFGALEASDEPLLIELIDPVTSSVIKDKDGKTSYIKAHAEDSKLGRQFDREFRADRLDKVRKGEITVDAPIDQADVNRSKCAFLTTEWYLVSPDTQEEIAVPCTRDNAKEFYSLPATNWFGQVWLKVLNNANFMKRSAASSTSTQSGTSEETAG